MESKHVIILSNQNQEMKKIIAFLFAATMLLFFSACSKDNNDTTGSSSTDRDTNESSSSSTSSSSLANERYFLVMTLADGRPYEEVLTFKTSSTGDVAVYVDGEFEQKYDISYSSSYHNGGYIWTDVDNKDPNTGFICTDVDNKMPFHIETGTMYLTVEGGKVGYKDYYDKSTHQSIITNPYSINLENTTWQVTTDDGSYKIGISFGLNYGFGYITEYIDGIQRGEPIRFKQIYTNKNTKIDIRGEEPSFTYRKGEGHLSFYDNNEYDIFAEAIASSSFEVKGCTLLINNLFQDYDSVPFTKLKPWQVLP